VLARLNFAAKEQQLSQGRVLESHAFHLCYGRGVRGVKGGWKQLQGSR